MKIYIVAISLGWVVLGLAQVTTLLPSGTGDIANLSVTGILAYLVFRMLDQQAKTTERLIKHIETHRDTKENEK